MDGEGEEPEQSSRERITDILKVAYNKDKIVENG